MAQQGQSNQVRIHPLSTGIAPKLNSTGTGRPISNCPLSSSPPRKPEARRRGTPWRRPVQISRPRQRSARLCRPALRKASGFPAGDGARCPLPRSLEGSAFQTARRGLFGRTFFGKAEPFRTSGGGAAGGPRLRFHPAHAGRGSGEGSFACGEGTSSASPRSGDGKPSPYRSWEDPIKPSWPARRGCWEVACLDPARAAFGTAFFVVPSGDNPALTGA